MSLALEFPVKSVLLGMLKLTEYLTQLPDEKPTSKTFPYIVIKLDANWYSIVTTATSKLRQLPASATLLFNVAAHTDQQLKQFKVLILSLLLSLLSQKVLIQGVSIVLWFLTLVLFTNTLSLQISIIDAEDSTILEDIAVKWAIFVLEINEYTHY